MSRAAFSPEGVTFGVCLVALGILGTLANLGTIEALPILRTWWPLSLVLWGVLELVDLWTRRASARGAAQPSHGRDSSQGRS